jgi:Antitoxin VbhA
MAAISEEEQLRRRRITDSVIGTNVMEGQPPDATTLAILRRYDRGDLTLEEFSAEMDAHARSLIRMHGTMAGVA